MDIIELLHIKSVILDFLRCIAFHPESVLSFIIDKQGQYARFVGLEIFPEPF